MRWRRSRIGVSAAMVLFGLLVWRAVIDLA
jgi:hypothetical protein